MRRVHARALFGALATAQVAYGSVPGTRTPRQTQGVLALLLGTSAADAVVSRGAVRGLSPIATAAVVGSAAEAVGVRTGVPFGRYRYSDRLGPSVRDVSVAVPVAWALLARPAWVAAGIAVGPDRPVKRVVVASAALTAWDVFLDPRMAAEGYWLWDCPGVYEGIPFSNFVGWFLTGLPIFAAFAVIDGDDDPVMSGGDALAIYTWTWLGELIANVALWDRWRVAAAGGVSMGAVAIPALVAWTRAQQGRRR